MKRASRTHGGAAPAALAALAGPPCGLRAGGQKAAGHSVRPAPPPYLSEASERIARSQDVLALRLSCAALDLQRAPGTADDASVIEAALGEIDRILGELRGHAAAPQA